MTDFILALHSHLPYVLNHGRWPHGSDWLCEAALDTYLPLIEALSTLERAGVSAPVTIGVTPVLANQLVNPAFAAEMETFIAQRLAACDEAHVSLATTGDAHLVPLAGFWRERFLHLRELFRSLGGNIVAVLRDLEGRGRIEIMGSAATHGFLPLLGRDESIQLQLALGQAEHRRLFGRAPKGCWLPECAYRPRGAWEPLPGARRAAVRPGTDEHLATAGFRYFFTDANLAEAGVPLGASSDVPLGAERFDSERHDVSVQKLTETGKRSPYHAYRMAGALARSVAAFVRDPRSSMQVWSKQKGYPGDPWYLEFHKIRPDGLKYWRVTGPVDLGAKRPYEPAAAQGRASEHARHFASLLASTAVSTRGNGPGVIVSPFDTELFGHWWFEGVDFIQALYGRLKGQTVVRPVTAALHLDEHPPRTTVRLSAGSWGANGDWSMWLNDQTERLWRRLWALEDAFWDAAPAALASESARPVLAQAARELLLAQASDWQFMISTGAVTDYAERRFALHCDDAERLVAALAPGAGVGALEAAQRVAEELRRRDDLFPDVLTSVATALG
ncbi:MAG: DUF1957 domain-containing protein [Gemmatimonadales bacterium]|nr:DUF1957 domain-containing protein [Gemmatimonadales bacterium]